MVLVLPEGSACHPGVVRSYARVCKAEKIQVAFLKEYGGGAARRLHVTEAPWEGLSRACTCQVIKDNRVNQE